MLGKIALLEDKFKSWVFLFLYLFDCSKMSFFADVIIGQTPLPPMSGFVSISLTPPPPLGADVICESSL